MKNYRGFRPSPARDGDIDSAVAFAAMRTAGYRGRVGIESYSGDVPGRQRSGLEYLRRLARDEEASE